MNQNKIAKQLNVSQSALSRELSRHTGKQAGRGHSDALVTIVEREYSQGQVLCFATIRLICE